ncbi:hypothetical protein BN12_1620006 [Nostocoides japonicum T1-X7]|uniref:Uncharacterized protein n=1 Tax=Nostocoides japonicum T1-X7 TaxID=1194083 RepID=A0A077LW81_9MICO|nr:hypothetical protein BN12_1620006 [Tetrasphaera japonica T1-X7]
MDHRVVTQLVQVLPPVVGAEQQLPPTGEAGADVGLCAAAVAPVGGGQLGCQRRVHVCLLHIMSIVRTCPLVNSEARGLLPTGYIDDLWDEIVSFAVTRPPYARAPTSRERARAAALVVEGPHRRTAARRASVVAAWPLGR